MERHGVSIIVPVYNTEKYLRKTIDSILNQTYMNIEVILINDGSTDNSGKICDEYGKKDKRIRVIHKKKSGVSITRNIGIEMATGDYIQFVDSDDYVEPDMTEIAVNALSEKIDLVICSYKAEFISNSKNVMTNYICPNEGIYEINEFMVNFGEYFHKHFINPIWNKIYVVKILKKHNLKFVDDLNMGEDLLFNIEYLKVCECVHVIKNNLYHYINFNINSLTASVKEKYFLNQQMLFSKVRLFLLENDYCNEQNKKYIEMSYTDSIISCFENLFHVNTKLAVKDKKENICEIINNDCVRKNIEYFKSNSTQKRFIGMMIEIRSCRGIYLYFIIKPFFRNNLGPLYILLKRMLEK